jgi:glycosyltransferase involved in cell wall biosynthesis
MTNVDKISVIIPMYNAERTIVRCLNSVVNQTYKAWYQIIVVNDGSKDASLSTLKNYITQNPHHNIEIVDKLNGGVATARNAGLKIAKGEWIALLDSDDEWLPNKTEVQMTILKDNPFIDFLGCNLMDQETRVLWRLKNSLSKVTTNDLLIKVYPQTSTAIFKQNVIDDVGYYDETLPYYEEGDYWLRISQQKQLWFSPEQLVIYDGGKPGFGFSGMTAQLADMHRGNLVVLKRLYLSKNINLFQYIIVKSYSQLKYLRRILIVKFKKW